MLFNNYLLCLAFYLDAHVLASHSNHRLFYGGIFSYAKCLAFRNLRCASVLYHNFRLQYVAVDNFTTAGFKL